MTAFAPGGWLTLTALILIFSGAAAALARCRLVLLKVLAAGLAFTTAALAGVAGVNRYYGYYTTWGTLSQDLQADNGTSALPVRIPVPAPTASAPQQPLPRASRTAGPWKVHTLLLPGPVSGVSGRTALVVLPPDPSRREALPVLVLLHGEPGAPSSWTSGLHIAKVLLQEASLGTIGPMAVVLPDVHGAFRDQQCLDASTGPRLATYLRVDVPRDIAASLSVAPPGTNWAVGGLSEGGFCAADTGLHVPAAFGSVAVMDGTFRPDLTNRVITKVYGGRPAAAARDNLDDLVRTSPRLPRFWVMAGTGNANDYRAAVAFATAVGLRQDLRFVTVKGGRHTTPAWRAALPDLLRWAWASTKGAAYGGSVEMPLG